MFCYWRILDLKRINCSGKQRRVLTFQVKGNEVIFKATSIPFFQKLIVKKSTFTFFSFFLCSIVKRCYTVINSKNHQLRFIIDFIDHYHAHWYWSMQKKSIQIISLNILIVFCDFRQGKKFLRLEILMLLAYLA